MTLVFLCSAPTPARTALYDALAEEAARVRCRFYVLYCAKTELVGGNNHDYGAIRHAHTILRGFHPSLTGIQAHLNPGVLAELNLLKPDTIVVDGPWSTPTMLIAGLNIYSPHPRRFFRSEDHADAALHKSGMIAWLRRRVYRTFDGFAVPNAKSAEWAIAQAGAARSIVNLPNAIDAAFFKRPSGDARSQALQALGLPAEGRVLVQVSALTERKGVLPLAKAFLGLTAADRAGACLVFVGEGGKRTELESLAAQSAGTIRLLGQLPPEEVRQVLWASDAFVLNTRLDPNPLSAIEASAAGLPIVMSAAAGNIREIVEAPNAGFVIRDPADPTDALRAVLSASDEQLAAMGARAAANAQRFDAPAVARSLIAQLYPSD